nr:L1 major capsid protein [Equus caballus papillomavirus 2]UWL63445.1 L1 major capsid protein [Equus caballus papillomavirus 2]UXM19338.1 L1 major capsid protein [Equus caballus papillomavirus 2]UXM19344.1 L1 major capsid protein [Equus caballus papillomavirus 2]
MAFWTMNRQHLYLPPNPVSRVLGTDEYVKRLSVFYHGNSERMLMVGHPFFALKNDRDKLDVPKVSSNQYRVFEVVLPNPNKFALADQNIYNPETSRLVWALRGVEVSRGQPLGIGVTGSTVFNKLYDVENPGKRQEAAGEREDKRVNMGFDVKQSQLLMVGCKPAIGEHWTKARPCNGGGPDAACPPLELVHTPIEDGDMGDIGFGCLDFKYLCENKSDIPLDIVDATCKYPDYIKMGQEASGNCMFFYARREQMYTRHFFARDGEVGEKAPEGAYMPRTDKDKVSDRYVYGATPSGSLVSTDSQIFNRPYWLQRAQGQNNGVCWHDKVYVTVFDNTRGTNFSISVKKAQAGGVTEFSSTNFKTYLRHVEEYELSFIFELCSVTLSPEVMAHLHTMDPDILEEWEIGINPPMSSQLSDTYRFITSSATKCPRPVVPDPQPAKLTFWQIDLQERLSLDLDQFTLGRRFLAQSGLSRRGVSRKRPAPSTTRSKRPTKKRKA